MASSERSPLSCAKARPREDGGAQQRQRAASARAIYRHDFRARRAAKQAVAPQRPRFSARKNCSCRRAKPNAPGSSSAASKTLMETVVMSYFARLRIASSRKHDDASGEGCAQAVAEHKEQPARGNSNAPRHEAVHRRIFIEKEIGGEQRGRRPQAPRRLSPKHTQQMLHRPSMRRRTQFRQGNCRKGLEWAVNGTGRIAVAPLPNGGRVRAPQARLPNRLFFESQPLKLAHRFAAIAFDEQPVTAVEIVA